MQVISELSLILLVPLTGYVAWVLRKQLAAMYLNAKIFKLKIVAADEKLEKHEKKLDDHEHRIKGLESERTTKN